VPDAITSIVDISKGLVNHGVIRAVVHQNIKDLISPVEKIASSDSLLSMILIPSVLSNLIGIFNEIVNCAIFKEYYYKFGIEETCKATQDLMNDALFENRSAYSLMHISDPVVGSISVKQNLVDVFYTSINSDPSIKFHDNLILDMKHVIRIIFFSTRNLIQNNNSTDYVSAGSAI